MRRHWPTTGYRALKKIRTSHLYWGVGHFSNAVNRQDCFLLFSAMGDAEMLQLQHTIRPIASGL